MAPGSQPLYPGGMPDPLYTIENCRVAYQLDWSLSVFWKQGAPAAGQWLATLQQSTEPDGVRVLEHRLPKSNVSQFLLSTKPSVSPSMAIRSVKGRLQYLVRDTLPKAFRRNYSIHSVGSANVEAVQQYVASQLGRHPMGDPNVQERFTRYQFFDERVDLTLERRSSYGQFIYNLHLVLVHRERGVDVREDWLRTVHQTLPRISGKKGHLLSRAGITADHIHLTIGCDVKEAPADVALSYMNNLAYAAGMKSVFQFGFYVGTFGRYDLRAVRRSRDS
jgi:REP element-mobilizing transposase RayT